MVFRGWRSPGGVIRVSVVLSLDFLWGEHSELAVEALVVPPPDPFQRRVLDLLDGAPGSAAADQLGLVEPVHALDEGVDAPISVKPRSGGLGGIREEGESRPKVRAREVVSSSG
jgi:hypothetical protein